MTVTIRPGHDTGGAAARASGPHAQGARATAERLAETCLSSVWKDKRAPDDNVRRSPGPPGPHGAPSPRARLWCAVHEQPGFLSCPRRRPGRAELSWRGCGGRDGGLRGPEQPLGAHPSSLGESRDFHGQVTPVRDVRTHWRGCKRLRDVSLGPRAPHPPPPPAIGPVTPGICRSFLFSPPKRACLLHVGGWPPGGLAIPGAPGRGSALILRAVRWRPGSRRPYSRLCPQLPVSASLCPKVPLEGHVGLRAHPEGWPCLDYIAKTRFLRQPHSEAPGGHAFGGGY